MVTKENLEAFKKAYDKALKDKKEIFMFEKQEVNINYAKYVIEFLLKP